MGLLNGKNQLLNTHIPVASQIACCSAVSATLLFSFSNLPTALSSKIIVFSLTPPILSLSLLEEMERKQLQVLPELSVKRAQSFIF